MAAGAGGGLTPTKALSAERLPTLDGVRGVAVLVVVIHNSAWIAGESHLFLLKLFSAVTATGWVGVQLFFVLSGFLITGILVDTRGAPRYFTSFYLRRTLRIFPPYYFLVAVIVLVAPLLATDRAWVELVRSRQWVYWVYLSNWFTGTPGIDPLSHTWSLAVEEQFYLAWPLLVWLCSPKALLRLCVVLVAVTPLVRLGLRVSGLSPEAAYTFTIARWDALALGAILALLLREDGGPEVVRRWRGRAVALGVLVVAGIVVRQHGFHSHELPVQVLGQSAVAILSAALVAYAIEDRPGQVQWLRAGLSRRWLRQAGKYSYAMYLFHQPIQQYLTPILGPQVRGADSLWRLARVSLYLAGVLALSLGAALVSWRLIEKPCLVLKDRIAPRLTGAS